MPRNSRSTPNDPHAVDLPHFSGQVPHDVEQAILRLREAIEFNALRVSRVNDQLSAMPRPLTIEEIQARLSPTGDYPLPTAGLLNTTPPVTAPTTGGNTPPPPPVDDGIPDYLSIVQADAAAAGITGASTDEEVFNFMRQVVADINASGMNPAGIVCGFTDAPPGGDNVFTCAGSTYRYARVTFSNDHTFKLLIDADPGGARTPEWADEGITAGLYRVATPPGDPC